MGIKLHEAVLSDGSHYSWLFFCPGCRTIHQCDNRWTYNGNAEQPTFSPSVLVHGDPSIGRPRCHSFVTDGRINYLEDTEHSLAGQTVDLPDWPIDGWPNEEGP